MDSSESSANQDPEPQPLSLAERVAKRLVVEKGYRPEVPEEAAQLLEACDAVLTFSDGYSFKIACIVDAEQDPERELSLTSEDLVEIGSACLKFAGKVNNAQLPVVIEVIEVRERRSVRVDQRLARLHRPLPGRAKVKIRCFSLNRVSDSVTSPSAFNGLFAGRGFFERVMRDEDGDASAPAGHFVLHERFPWATVGLIAALGLAFAAEFVFAVRPHGAMLGPDIETLVALGGLTRPLVASGEYWRLLTAAFLHGDVAHILLNCIALFMAGAVLEGLLGRAWFLALFGIGTLGGSIASFVVNDPNIVSVGASGAIMALVAAALVLVSRTPPGQDRTEIQMGMLRVLVPALIPLATSQTGGQIDFAAHFGGAIVGAGVGLLFLRSRTSSPETLRPALARGLAATTAIGAALGFAFVASHYEEHSLSRHLIPDDEIVGLSDQELSERLPGYLEHYPRDPRTRYLAAMHDLDAGDGTAAEHRLRSALADEALLGYFPDGDLESALRLQLAQIVVLDGRLDEAREIGAPICARSDHDETKQAASSIGLCE